tara:strand:- start:233 stop:655 length:423 start_codon:yes stop_codon:yes gene_type:complete
MDKKNFIKNTVGFFIFFFIFFPISNISYSVDPDEIMQDKKQEVRARNISKNIRCMVCQNQSIDESNSSLAKDLRILIRDKIKSGKSDKEIYKFLTDRYGDFVLLKPTFKTNTIILWIFPFALLIIAILIVSYHHKKYKKN